MEIKIQEPVDCVFFENLLKSGMKLRKLSVFAASISNEIFQKLEHLEEFCAEYCSQISETFHLHIPMIKKIKLVGQWFVDFRKKNPSLQQIKLIRCHQVKYNLDGLIYFKIKSCNSPTEQNFG